MRNNPTGAMGLRDYLGPELDLAASGIPIVNLPGCPVQPDNITETLLQPRAAPGRRWVPRSSSTSRGGRPRIFGRTVHESCDRAGLAEQGRVRRQPRRRPVPGQARLQGPGRQVQRSDPRLDQRRRRLPERGRHLHGVHDARLPRQVHAVHGGRLRRLGCTRRTARLAHGPIVRYLRERRIRRTIRRRAGVAAPRAGAGEWLRRCLRSRVSRGGATVNRCRAR